MDIKTENKKIEKKCFGHSKDYEIIHVYCKISFNFGDFNSN